VSATVQNAGSVAGFEVAQIYITPPSLVNVTTPVYSLQGFQKVYLPTGGDPMPISFQLTASQLSVVVENGTRVITPGTYTVYISGHLPFDIKGELSSNVVTTTFTWP
jgi:beta-glucosidase